MTKLRKKNQIATTKKYNFDKTQIATKLKQQQNLKNLIAKKINSNSTLKNKRRKKERNLTP